ncbi:MAG TPA: O-antigen ligase family protein, partial [Candidatus Omnitrophota bacterium]|nr:O-antigen ligase family protein [Candidatus Omnitrophota bacterium]
GLIVAVFFVVLIFIYIFLGHSVRRSLDFDGRMTEYRHFDGYVQNNKNFFVFYEVPPRIYQDDAVKYRRRPLTGKEYQEVHEPFPDKAMVWPAGDWPGPNLAQNFIRVEAEQPVQDNKSDLFSRFVSKHKGRNIQQSRNQILFRIFIWRDMLADLRSHPYYFITGVGFHRSQRSHSIEILGWGRQEWGRDGWITPHNSFFNMIYRGGVIGWALLGAIMFLIVQMTKDFGRLRIFSGGLLVASLVYWIVISNFLVYLEVPHTAIPFWSLLGVVCAYWKDRLRERPALQR